MVDKEFVEETTKEMVELMNECKKQGALEVLEKWVGKFEEFNFSFVDEMKKELKELKKVGCEK